MVLSTLIVGLIPIIIPIIKNHIQFVLITQFARPDQTDIRNKVIVNIEASQSAESKVVKFFTDIILTSFNI